MRIRNDNSDYWLRKATGLWVELVRRRDKRCVTCRQPGSDCHHIIGKHVKHLRHEVANGILLCRSCHETSFLSAHRTPKRFHEWLKTHRPDTWAWVERHRWENGKPNYREAYEKLSEILRISRKWREDENQIPDCQ